MGGAIARGLAAGKKVNSSDITVCSPNNHKELDALKAQDAAINVSTDNAKAVEGTDAIIIAVKPWLLDKVMGELAPKIDFERQLIISIVAGTTLDHLHQWLEANMPLSSSSFQIRQSQCIRA